MSGGLTKQSPANILYSSMSDISVQDFSAGGLEGRIGSDWHVPSVLGLISHLRDLVNSEGADVLSDGRNRVVAIDAAREGWSGRLAVKSFGKRSRWRDAADSRRGTRARRTFETACEMLTRGVATPEPVCYVEKWESGRLRESYYISVLEEGHVSFKDELVRLFNEDPECGLFMDLMQTVASHIAKMHTAGIMHRDLGNQNILLRRKESGWTDVMYMDLNRARIHPQLTLAQRARDISRIYLPSDLLRVFIEMYFEGEVPPREFLRAENSFRRRFRWHTRTRPLRHPLRYLGRGRKVGGDDPAYPLEKDMWIWDSRSAQPISVMRPKDRRKWYPRGRHISVALSAARMYKEVKTEYTSILADAYKNPVDMRGRLGMALGLASGNDEREIEFLDELGEIPVLLRVQPHVKDQLRKVGSIARRLRADGREITLALLQDRRRVMNPQEWDEFVRSAAAEFAGHVTAVEAGHAINRVKWGLWDIRDYAGMAVSVHKHFGSGGVRVLGPACIDFEYQYVTGALEALPEGFRFGGLSHHLYVDRRGAPENRQSGYAALEKAALLKAISRISDRTDERVVVSEVNWPILGTGVWSPVNSPYESPGVRHNDPSVSEDDYAAYMIRYLLISLCSGMVEQVFWWRLIARGFGLVDDSDPSGWRKRPAFLMLKQFIKMMDGSSFIFRKDLGAGANILHFERTGGAMFAVGITDGRAALTEPPFECSRILDAFGKDIEEEGQIKLSGTPVYFRAAAS